MRGFSHRLMMLKPMQTGASGYARLQSGAGESCVQINARGLRVSGVRVFWYGGGAARELGRARVNPRGEASLSVEAPRESMAPERLEALLVMSDDAKPAPLLIGLYVQQSAGSLLDAKNALLALCERCGRSERKGNGDGGNVREGSERVTPDRARSVDEENTARASNAAVGGASQTALQAAPQAAPLATLQGASQDTSQTGPQGVQQAAPLATLQGASQDTSQATLQAAPRAMPQTASQAASQAAPQAASQTTPQGALQAAPQGALQAAPQGALQVTPQAAPQGSATQTASQAALQGAPRTASQAAPPHALPAFPREIFLPAIDPAPYVLAREHDAENPGEPFSPPSPSQVLSAPPTRPPSQVLSAPPTRPPSQAPSAPPIQPPSQAQPLPPSANGPAGRGQSTGPASPVHPVSPNHPTPSARATPPARPVQPEPLLPPTRSNASPVDRLPALRWPGAFEKLRPHFEKNRPQRLFNLPGWRFVCAGPNGPWVGYEALDGRVRRVAYALPDERPPGDGRPWRARRGLDGATYQVLWQRADIAPPKDKYAGRENFTQKQ